MTERTSDEETRSATSSMLADQIFAGAGEMAGLMRSTDWSRTRLGAIEDWPQGLRTMQGVVLGSRFPMMIWWGPNLFNFYNDAYRPILRDKHPQSLGAPAAELWSEIWDFAGPLAHGILEGGPATWMEDVQLFIKSGAIAEETYFTFSYSPIPGDDGKVGGLLNTVQETTVKVQSERQIRMLHDLSARTADAKSEADAYSIAIDVLATNELDLPFVVLYSISDHAVHAQLVGVRGLAGQEGGARSPQVSIVKDAPASWPLTELVQLGREIVVDDLPSRFGPLPIGQWNGRPERAILLPLSRASQSSPYAVLIAGISPHRTFDERYRRFFRATADQMMSVLANARAYETERNRAESLTEIDRVKTAFFSNVSHEFRTPLTLILAPVEDALADPAKSLRGESLEAVHRSALRLLRLVNSLLDFSRIEAGRLQSRFEPTDLAVLTGGLAGSFQSLVESAGLTLSVDCPSLSEPVYVDRSQWEKIVLNLISNAFKFTLAGEIAVSLRTIGDHVELSVKDSGTGIPAEELPKIFDRFHRVEGARGRTFEGTGIGLALVHELVRQHEGSVRVESIVDTGSLFVVRIPLGKNHLPQDRVLPASGIAAEVTGAAPFVLEAKHWGTVGGVGMTKANAIADAINDETFVTAERLPSQTSSARVLVADDNADMREYLVRLLASRWSVEVVGDGQAALESALLRPPDLVLTDVMMPRLDGMGLLRALRANVKTSTIPVVLLSARAGEEAIIGGLETGADDYLVKPFSARELLTRVGTHLEMARLRRKATEVATELAETRAALLDDLDHKNKELEAFSYSVSHDLRAPLRGIDGFCQALLEDHADQLDADGKGHLLRVRAAAQRMGQLIDDLLSLSRVSRAELKMEQASLSAIAAAVVGELRRSDQTRKVDVVIHENVFGYGDPKLVRIVLDNLVGNAWKFTAKTPAARIEVGALREGSEVVYYVRDNGAGFNMAYVERLFGAFQRLHSDKDFSGTGIGLATVQRIILRHGGRLWADSVVSKGASFYFTLPPGEPQP